PRFGLPVRGRTSEPNRALAAGRRRLRGPTPKTGRGALESGRGSVGQCAAGPFIGRPLGPERHLGLAGNRAGSLSPNPAHYGDQPGVALLQPAADLSARWRPNPSRTALVSIRAGAQPGDCDSHRIRGIDWVRRSYLALRSPWYALMCAFIFINCGKG